MREEFKQFAGKTVLVTGATGFTGVELTKKLAAAGAKLRIMARQSSNLDSLSGIEMEVFRGEVFDPEVIKQAADGVNFIFHVAAAFRETLPTEEEYLQVHLTSTQLLAKEVLGKPEFERFLHVSTVGVHGHVEGEADEEYRFAPGDPYQRTKLEGELWLAKFGKESGLPFSIVRPGPIFGPGDMRLLKLFKMVNKGFFLMLGKGQGWYSLVHVDDLTNIMMLAAAKPEGKNEIFIASGGEAIRSVDMAKLIGAKLGKKVRIIRLPLWPFYLASDICVAVCQPFGIKPPIYRRRVDFYTKDRNFDNSKVKNVLGYTFIYGNKDGLEETAEWYLENNLLS